MAISEIPILIPAYRPGEPLVNIVLALRKLCSNLVIVVDDGSEREFQQWFSAIAALPNVQLLRHAVNLGKGAALKTGINHILLRYPRCPGVVTADADGQHHPQDILRIAERLHTANSGTLILGVRSLGRSAPLRSRFGNRLTRLLMRAVAGQKLSDSQTGLRGIPANLLPHLLQLRASGYEFELDMLMACKFQACPIEEEPIRTIYVDENRSSHFRPVLDSMRIYFVLFRFSILALLTALLDNFVFALLLSSTGSIGRSQFVARTVAACLNYAGARRTVFHSRQTHAEVLPKYLALVACSGGLSYAAIEFLHTRMHFGIMAAKLLAEGLLFIANFAIQRDFIFTHHQSRPSATDWDHYYRQVPFTARLTRRYTSAILVNAIKRYIAERKSIIEIGGANSCFLNRILREIRPSRYQIIDSNGYGLSLLDSQAEEDKRIQLRKESVLALERSEDADLVLSVGLVEHFDARETRQAVLAHFDVLPPGGIAIITFPTPTWLYRIARGLLEVFGLWQFPDERPLQASEVRAAVSERGVVLEEKTLWPLILTQRLIIAKKHAFQ